MHLISWKGGEVAEGAEVEPGVFTTRLENMYLDEQKLPNIRESTKNIGYISIKNYKQELGSHIGEDTSVAVYALDENKTSSVFVVKFNGEIRTITLNVPLEHERVSFFELNATNLTNAANTIQESGIIILICGYDKMYYLNNFRIVPLTITVNSANANIISPKWCYLLQQRLMVICKGPNLSSVNKPLEEHRVLFSVTGTIDNFNIQSSGSLPSIAIDYVIFTEPGEKFLAITTMLDDMAVITTNIGVRTIVPRKEEDNLITADNISTKAYAIGGSICSPAFEFSIYLVVATKRTLKAKDLKQVRAGSKSESIDLELPLLAAIESDIVNISLNPGTQTIDCFLEDGSVKSMHYQSIIPSASAPLSLPITTSHKNSDISWINLSGNKSIIEIYRSNDSTDGWLIFTEKTQDMGLLSEGVLEVTWDANVYESTSDSIKINFIVANDQFPPENIDCLWLNVESNQWVRCKHSRGDTFLFDYFVYPTIQTGNYKCIIVFNDFTQQYLPAPYYFYPSTAEIYASDQGSVFYGTTAAPVGRDYGPEELGEGMLHDLKLLVSIVSCVGVIGWRNFKGLVSPLGSQKGKLIFKHPELDHLVEFVTNSNADVKTKSFSDYGEVDFSLSKNQRYSENMIYFKSISHDKLSNKQKFIYLLSEDIL